MRTDPHLGDNIIFLTLGGSHAYGTSVEGSDVDIRGCTLPLKADLLGSGKFEQCEDRDTDTVVYGLHKFIDLVSCCNPNTIELLGCKPEHYFLMTPTGKELIENRHLFLSQQATYSFGGYANQQLRRLENALARDSYPQEDKERHVLNSIQLAMRTFHERYQAFEEGSIALCVAPSQKQGMDAEIFMDIHLSHYPLRDFIGLWSEMNCIVRDYGKLNKRNHKKDDLHLNKHAMHLIRLYLMCLDILEKEEIITYREAERDLLLSIRNGKFQKEDGSFHPDFFELVNQCETRLAYAAQHTALPEHPNYQKIEDLMMSIHERVVKNED